MWFVYILECGDGSFYTGTSNDVQARLLEHQKGKGGRYTRSHKPVKLVYSEPLPSKSAALSREFQIKSLSRQDKQKIISAG